MGFMDKIKGLILGPDEDEDYGDIRERRYDDENDEYDFLNNHDSSQFEEPRPTFSSSKRQGNIVDFGSSKQSMHSSQASKPHVVVAKLERFEDIGEVTNSINEKRIVIINLESASNEVTQRIIDFVYGVTIANKGELKRVAYRTYIIKPNGYEYSGIMEDGSDSNSIDGILFNNK